MAISYLVQDLTMGTQQVFKGQKELLAHLYSIGCKVDKNQLAEIHIVEGKDHNGELMLESVYGHILCIEEVFSGSEA